jgi:hypothetical protein
VKGFKITKPAFTLLFLAWVVVMMYPDPFVLAQSIRNFRHPNVDAAAVARLAARLPNDPALIEQAVLNDVVPYAYDWQTAGVPWFFPTTKEAVRQKAGDCESRAVVLASILAAKHIPYHLVMSIDHIWVDYPGKQPNAMENNAVAIGGNTGSHSLFALHWPKDFNLWKEVQDQVGLYWTPMPPAHKAVLLGGLLFISLWNALAAALRETRAGPLALRPLPRPKRRSFGGIARRRLATSGQRV